MSTLRVDNLRGQTADGTNRYVVQVVFGALTSDIDYSSTTITDIFSLSITPLSTSNKVLIFGSMGHYINNSNATDSGDYLIKRGSTQVFATDTDLGRFGYFRSDGFIKTWKPMMTFLDSPATTSSITYKLVHDPHTNNSGGTFGKDVTSLTLMEIAQ
jgi:hypothetical protein